jgi:hypothetical protein
MPATKRGRSRKDQQKRASRKRGESGGLSGAVRAFEIGGDDGLVRWAKRNRGQFYQLYANLMLGGRQREDPA